MEVETTVHSYEEAGVGTKVHSYEDDKPEGTEASTIDTYMAGPKVEMYCISTFVAGHFSGGSC